MVFAAVSVVVKGTVSKGAENIELSANCLDVEMHATKLKLLVLLMGISNLLVMMLQFQEAELKTLMELN